MQIHMFGISGKSKERVETPHLEIRTWQDIHSCVHREMTVASPIQINSNGISICLNTGSKMQIIGYDTERGTIRMVVEGVSMNISTQIIDWPLKVR